MSTGTGWTSETPVVSWTVTAVTADTPYTPERGECFQVGLNAGAANGVAAGDGERASRGLSRVPRYFPKIRKY